MSLHECYSVVKSLRILTCAVVAVLACGAVAPQAVAPLAPAVQAAAPHASPQVAPLHITPQRTITIDVVGDLMLGWRVDTLVRTIDADAPFVNVRRVLLKADAAIGNLECVLSDRGTPARAKSPKAIKAHKEFLLRGSPLAASGLARAGFAALTLANNHTLDYGRVALDDTLAALHAQGIATAGAGDNLAQAWRPAYFQRHGLRFALIGVSEVIPRGYLATNKGAGVAPGRDPATGDINAAYLRVLDRAIRSAHRDADIVIVYEHWGKELVGASSPSYVRLAHAAIDDGAALVLGSHPHVVGPIERYRGGLIAYTLGNFVFDTHPGVQSQSAILEITLRGGVVDHWRTLPVLIREGVPEPVQGLIADDIQRRLAGAVLTGAQAGPIRGTAQVRPEEHTITHGPPSRS